MILDPPQRCGLAGVARHDGELGAKKALDYLASTVDPGTLSADEIAARLKAKNLRVVEKPDLALIAKAEEGNGPVQAPNSFHFFHSGDLLKVIDEGRKAATGA